MVYNIDIVLCIDLTLIGCVEFCKRINDYLLSDIEAALKCAGKNADNIRIKIIAFRDSCYIEERPVIEESRFFNLHCKQTLEPEYFSAWIRHLKHSTRIEKSNALEGLALAINSEWTHEGDRLRHIIVMLTDAPAHKLEEAKLDNSIYPANLPTSLAELCNLWMTPSSSQNGGKSKLKQPAKRLVVFGPQMYPWPELFESWDQVVYNPVHLNEGLNNVTYEDIITSIVGSV